MNKDTNVKNAVALELNDVIKIYGQGDNSANRPPIYGLTKK